MTDDAQPAGDRGNRRLPRALPGPPGRARAVRQHARGVPPRPGTVRELLASISRTAPGEIAGSDVEAFVDGAARRPGGGRCRVVGRRLDGRGPWHKQFLAQRTASALVDDDVVGPGARPQPPGSPRPSRSRSRPPARRGGLGAAEALGSRPGAARAAPRPGARISEIVGLDIDLSRADRRAAVRLATGSAKRIGTAGTGRSARSTST